MNDGPGRPIGANARRHVPVLVVAIALHLGLLVYFTPARLFLARLPIHTFDYALHVYQVDRAVTAFRQTGHLWSYDPFVLAGQPAGVVEDLTSKSVELFVIAAARIGMNPWLAFDLYVLLIHLAMPWVAWKAARLFELSRLASALAVLFWVILWHFDSLAHWFWYVGMISWAAASTLVVLVVALMYRALRDHVPRTYVALGAITALVTLVHPFAVLTLVLPLGVLYARALRRLAPWEHAAIAAATVAAAATSLVWIGPAIRFRHYIGEVDAFLWPTLEYVLLDWLDLLKDVLMTGQPVRTGFRTLALGAAVVGLLRLRRAKDDRFVPLAVLVVGSVVLAYASGYSSALRQTQPYRHLGPAMLAAALVAALMVVEVFSADARRALGHDARLAVALGLVVAVPHLARTVLGYVPALLPTRMPARSAFRPGPLPGASNDELPLIVMGHDGPRPEYQAIGRHLEERGVGERGRVAAFDWVLGEYLAAFTHVPVLGGIPQRNIPQVAAHPLRHDLTPAHEGDDAFGRYLRQYAVAAVITHGPQGPVDTRLDLLEPEEGIGEYRIYRVRRDPSYFEAGSGRVAEQRLDSVSVTNASGSEVVLRFHWLETLRCRPNCTVERAAADRDLAGFLRVRNPPASFEIYNAF